MTKHYACNTDKCTNKQKKFINILENKFGCLNPIYILQPTKYFNLIYFNWKYYLGSLEKIDDIHF